jgi:hypothetical protein
MKIPLTCLIVLLAACTDSEKDIANCSILNNTVDTQFEHALLSGNKESFTDIESKHEKTRQAIPNCKFPTTEERNSAKKCAETISKLQVAYIVIGAEPDAKTKAHNQQIINKLDPILNSIPNCKYPYAR